MIDINTMLSVAILLILIVMTIFLVLSIGNPIVDAAVKATEFKSAEDDLHFIDDYIRSAAREGKDATRVFSFTSPKAFESIPREDAIQYSAEGVSSVVEYFSRIFSGNFVYIGGNNVQCQERDADGDGTTDLVAENEKIRAVFRRITATSALNTSSVLTRLMDKTNNVNISIGNSSIVINEDYSTSSGVGYTEIGRSGLNLPVCQVHLFVNSTLDYDVYYKLYAGADFLVIEVRNIT